MYEYKKTQDKEYILCKLFHILELSLLSFWQNVNLVWGKRISLSYWKERSNIINNSQFSFRLKTDFPPLHFILLMLTLNLCFYMRKAWILSRKREKTLKKASLFNRFYAIEPYCIWDSLKRLWKRRGNIFSPNIRFLLNRMEGHHKEMKDT